MEIKGSNPLKPLAQKFGIKEGCQILVLNDPGILVSLISPLPENARIVKTSTNKVNMVICFFSAKNELKEIIPLLENMLLEKGMCWCCWAKKSSKLFSGITEDMIRNEAILNGLVDIKVCAVNADYSGLKIVRRKK